MLLLPTLRNEIACDACRRPIEPGQPIVMQTTGTLKKIGGAGVMRDCLRVADAVTVYLHRTPCPR